MTSGAYAPYRSTLPRPSLRVHQLVLPCVSSRSTQTHIDGETTPAIGPTPPRSWHGISSIGVPSASRPAASCALGRPRESSASPRAASRRSARRASGRSPGPSRSAGRRGRTGRGPARPPRRPVGRRPGTPRRRASGPRPRRSPRAARVGRDPGQRVLGAGGRRAPVHRDVRAPPGRPARRPALAAPTATTMGSPRAVRDSAALMVDRQERPATACRAAAALEAKTEAPASAQAPAACRSRPCGSSAVPISDTTTDQRLRPAQRGADRRRQFGRRVGVRAVAEHHVEQEHRGTRGRPPPARAAPAAARSRSSGAAGRRCTRRAEVEHACARGVRADRPLRTERDVGRDRAERSPRRSPCASTQRVPPLKSPRSRPPSPGAGATVGRATYGQVGHRDAEAGQHVARRPR